MFEKIMHVDSSLSKEDLKVQIKQLRNKLALQQHQIKEKQVPVLINIDGWGQAGKGTLLSHMIRELDPRFYQVYAYKEENEEESRKPLLWRYIENIPERGKISFFDTSYIEELTIKSVTKYLSEKKLNHHLSEVCTLERQLRDNDYIIVKLFLHISKEEEAHRNIKLLEDRTTSWKVTDLDRLQVERRGKYEKAYEYILEKTDTDYNPWHIIPAKDKKEAEFLALTFITDTIEEVLNHPVTAPPITENNFPLLKMPELSSVPLDQDISDEEYKERLDDLQDKLSKLNNRIYKQGIPIVIAYEGWDASGKGGNIKRLTHSFDARGCNVHPIAAPSPEEKAKHYLWRFSTRLPKSSHVTLFDRSWYGRVLVERIEEYCSEDDWKRAYNEINEFEKWISDWGAIVIKFWIQIDKDTQLKRFEERQANPEKIWKITDEDWRNREKWDDYEVAVNEMLQKTSTSYAPWHIIESNSKKYARIKTLEIVLAAIEERLDDY